MLCDLGLPDGDGLDLVSEIAECCPALPVVVLTARAEEADVVEGLGCGAVDYITKPFALARAPGEGGRPAPARRRRSKTIARPSERSACRTSRST